jgi:hypothetical protein
MFGKKQKPEVEPDGGLALDGLTADQEAPVPSEEFRAAFEAADNVIKGRQEAEARAPMWVDALRLAKGDVARDVPRR